jgi:O-antigen/teichoic acid export membrane protein
MLLNVAGSVAVARGLGPDNRGQLAVAMLWPTLIAAIGGLGVQEAVTYFSGQEDREPSRVLATALWIGALQTALMVPAAYLALPFILRGQPAGVLAETRFYLWILPLYPLTLYPIALFQGRLALRPFNFTRLSVTVVYAILVAVLWRSHGLTVHSALMASLVATLGTFLLCFSALVIRGYWNWRPSRTLVRAVLWFGAKVHLGNLASTGAQRFDLVVLSVIVPPAQVGSYVIATSTGLVAALVPNAASLVLYPIFSRQDPATLPLSLARFLLGAGVATVVLGPFLMLLPRIVAYVFGSSFWEAQALAWVLVPAYAIRGWNQMLTTIVRGIGRPFHASLCQGIELAGLVFLLVMLVPKEGAAGAAQAVLGGAIVALVVLLVVSCREARLRPGHAIRLWSRDVRRLRLQAPEAE